MKRLIILMLCTALSLPMAGCNFTSTNESKAEAVSTESTEEISDDGEKGQEEDTDDTATEISEATESSETATKETEAGTETVTTENAAEAESTEDAGTATKETEAETEDGTETEIETADSSFTIDYHRIPSLYLKIYDQQTIDTANLIIDAFVAGKMEAEIPDMTMHELYGVCRILRIACPPLMGLCNVGFPDDDWTRHVTKISWTYLVSEEEFKQEKEAFESEVYRYMSYFEETDSEAMRALVVFMEYAHDIQYDHEVIDDDSGAISLEEFDFRTSAFTAIRSHSGICSNISEGLAFLYSQAGLEATTVGNWSPAAHEWNLVKIDNRYYYADATWSASSELYSCEYFGITADDRYSWGGGFVFEETQWNNYFRLSDYVDVSDARFVFIHGVPYSYIESYEVDHENQKILFHIEDGNNFEYGL